LSPITLGDRACAVATLRDLSESQRLEQQLLQAQKMEALGQLAAGIAHDFNNLLGSIRGSAEILRADLAAQGREARALERVLEATGRGAQLAHKLLSFGQLQPGESLRVELDRELIGVVDLARQLVGEDCPIELSLRSAPWCVVIDPVQVGQILMNLIVNARDAMARGGTIRVETSQSQLDAAAAARLDLAPGHFVRLAVEDSGTGIAPEIQGRIFEPFFTTKEIGKGSGLGLSTIYGIVRRSGGAITVQSEPGRTRFEILLPASGTALPTVEAAKAVTAVAGSGAVLLVEDDALLREILAESLRMNGYSVHESASPEQALQLAAAAGKLDLLLSDVIMAGMSGIALAEQIRALRPELPVLLMSGYTGTDLQERGLELVRCQLIQKPFDMAELTRKMAGLLAPVALP
jgi:nitrogen-specific signal transduction histidine kinase/CheY-like chemotaxis protein